jgi:hypothetical protein
MNFSVTVTIVLAFLFFHSKSVYSQQGDSIANKIFALIYNEQYTEAEKTLAQQARLIDPFYADLLKTDLYWWKYVRNQKKEDSGRLKIMLHKLTSSDSTFVNGKIMQLIGKSYQIRYEFKRYNIVGAIFLKSNIKNLLEEIKSEKLEYKENQLKLLYLYDTLFQYFNSWVNPLFADRKYTERENALKRLEQFVTDDDLVVKTLACYFIGKIYLNIEKKPGKGVVCFKQLNNLYPDNKIFIQLLDECK